MPLRSAPSTARPLSARAAGEAPECGPASGELRVACAELRETLAAGIERLEARVAQQLPSHEAWELVESNAAVACIPTDVTWTSQVKFWVNGEEVVLTNPLPSMTLLDWLRESKGMTGTHMGCNEGGCGICTVSLTRKDPSTGQLRQVPINSCLRRLCAVDGCHVLTTEGIGCQKAGFHSVQEAIAHGNGSQCGFCTPGWVMNMYSLLERESAPSREEVERAFDGNLCRCTGYRPILSAFGQFAQGGKLCGRHTSVPHPPEMLSYADRPLHFEDAASGDEWFRPTTLEELTAAMGQVGGKKLQLLCASTAINGITKYYESRDSQHVATAFVDVSLLPELQGVRFDSDGLRCGAAVPIGDVIDSLEQNSGQHPTFGTLATHMRRIASVQVRSVASWAGNVMFTREHPAFPSDMVTILAAAGATFEAKVGTEVRKLNALNLLSMGGTVLLLSMTIPKAPQGAILQTFKTAARAAFAHAYVNLGAYLTFQPGSRVVSNARIILGGTNTSLLQATRTEAALAGHSLNKSTLEQALAALKEDIAQSPSTDERTTADFRETLAAAFLYKCFLGASAGPLPDRLQSALAPFATAASRPISSGTESFGVVPSEGPISQYIPKTDSLIQASGEAHYPSDHGRGALFGQLVYSTVAKAKLLALDPTEALKMPGVRDFVTASAVPALNCVNPVNGAKNEKIFFEVNDVMPCVGAVLGMILADTFREAREAAKRVTQRYDTIGGPVVRNIEDAIQLRRTVPSCSAAGSRLLRGMRPGLASGRVAFEAEGVPVPEGCSKTAVATFKCGGQKHFYMETQSVCVTPGDGNHCEVLCSDQDANLTQTCIASALGQPAHHVNVKVPRCGGGFGGKLTRQLTTATATAVAAVKHGRPVRLQNLRYTDHEIVGGREAMQFKYQATFADTGKVDTMKLHMNVDCGWQYADSAGSVQMALGWSDNCYHYRSFTATSGPAVTDTPMGTFMRAPGCMQSILAAEVVMEHIAKTVGRPLEEVQAMNFYRVEDNPETPFGDHIGQHGYNWTIPTLWSQVQEKAQYAQRKASIQTFNEANRWRKKGIALSPVKYVMDTSAAEYYCGALVNIYGDGSVVVSIGSSEVGQGVNTVVQLCVANALAAPLEMVTVGPRETSKVPNNSATGGSGSTECSSAAALNACKDLCTRLAPYRKAGRSWAKVVDAANTDHVSLMASGWFAHQNQGNKNTYATYGVAASEVEIDALTGEVRVERVDVHMDLGTQLDAAVDIGQVQGGFVIALGYLLTEELKVDARGTQLHMGTWDYKIPGAYDIPVEFNVSLLKDSPNPVGVKGSKACAEPAMCLLSSVYLAVKNAIYAARRETGQGDDWFMLDTPLTPQRVCTAIGVPQSQFDLPRIAHRRARDF